MIISVFKTSIQEKDLTKVSLILNNVEGLLKWNTDLEDCDNVLRVESSLDITEKIVRAFSVNNLQCEELI
jgi:hypothetical protein